VVNNAAPLALEKISMAIQFQGVALRFHICPLWGRVAERELFASVDAHAPSRE
jgi:hypothetical protein